MKQKWLSVLIIIGGLAMLGIIVVQLSWIRNAVSVRQESFNAAVNNALQKAVDKLEKKEDVVFLSKNFDLSLDSFAPPPPPPPGIKVLPPPGREGDSLMVVHKITVDERYGKSEVIHSPPDGHLRKQSENELLVKKTERMEKKVRKMNEVIRDIIVEVETRDQRIENRIDTFSLQRELDKAFSDFGIRLNYEYAVLSPGKSSPVRLHSAKYTEELGKTAYKIGLFPNDLIAEPNFLLVYFPEQKAHLLKSMSLLMSASLLFTLLLLVAFIATIMAMFRQKKISEIKTDFINNMTHEFKTPLATISLAIDSINNPKVINDPAMIRKYTHVIREENTRMNTHVEQVLQMALYDRKEFRFMFVPVDLHQLAHRAVETVRLQVERRQGSLSLELNATNTMIEADEVHLLNCFLNLLDNANKYSPEKPEITVYSRNQGQNIILGVADKGIGMSKDTQSRIFEKFYRISTGNIHNVKGFGLGLSYAKAIVDAHKGKIIVSSEAGSGSRIEISLPLLKEADNNSRHES